jgi:hypothetical protein
MEIESQKYVLALVGKHLVIFNPYTAQHKKGDAGVPDRVTNSTAYTKSQTSWRTLKLED